MYKHVTTYTDFLVQEYPNETGLLLLLMQLQESVKIISSHVKQTGLTELLGASGNVNTHGEEVQKLDEFANDLLLRTFANGKQARRIGSEEIEDIIMTDHGEYDIFFDPLDGSSNINVNINIGTIFSIYKSSTKSLQKGENQVAAGYVLYGPAVMLTLATHSSVNIFTLDPSIGSFVLSHKNITIASSKHTYSINEAYYELLPSYIKNYLAYVKNPENTYEARYVGSMVADMHRTIIKGGIFLNTEKVGKPNAKLRLMYEVNPFAFIIQKAGGKSMSRIYSSENPNIEEKPTFVNPLTIEPEHVHQTLPVIMGSSEEVDKINQY